MRYLAATLFLAVAFAAKAEPIFCWGKSIDRVNASLAVDTFVVGTEPVIAERQKCGGGVDKNGEDIPKWDCFIQVWDLNDPSLILKLAYSKVNGKYLLANAQLCNIRTKQCRLFPNVEPCPERQKTSAPQVDPYKL